MSLQLLPCYKNHDDNHDSIMRILEDIKKVYNINKHSH